jgi:TonB family protein
LPDAKGEVVVRFTVDSNGSPVMSSFSAIHSEHPLLTEAVRTVIAGLRFEPARESGAGSKAVTDQVEIRYVFRPKN